MGPFKIQVIDQALVITDIGTGATVIDIPKSRCYYDKGLLEAEQIIRIFAVDSGIAILDQIRTQPKIHITNSLDSSGLVAYTVETFKTFARINLGFSAASGGSGAPTQVALNYSALVAGTTVGELAYAQASQGTQWLPAGLGGTYYPAGWYVWNGSDWISDRNAIANQLYLNELALNNKADNIDLTNEINARIAADEGTVTVHSDIVDAGSGYIITDTERNLLYTGVRETFETLSKNLQSEPYALVYTGATLTTIVYTVLAGTIVKTLNYTGDKLTSIVFSGDTPAGIQLTKTLNYTGDNLTSITYS